MRWRRRSEQTTKPCPAPGCTVPYEECYMHRADEAVWDFVVAHGEEVRAARRAADAQPKARLVHVEGSSTADGGDEGV